MRPILMTSLAFIFGV
ncbi:hypothetical protein ACNKHO_15560 [Shigella flexneri]